MTNQQEWTHLAQDKELKIKMLETTDDYVDQLEDGRMTWRNYYFDVSEQVFQQRLDRAPH